MGMAGVVADRHESYHNTVATILELLLLSHIG